VNSNAPFKGEVDWKLASPKSWVWTVAPSAPFCGPVDPERIDLIRRVCIQAGMIMEDASPGAIVITDTSAEGIRAAVTQLMNASQQIKALAEAASTLLR
jgi:hypothetical protein